MQPTDTAVTADKATLLLVDDEPSVLSALRRMFRQSGYRILQATRGADALQLLQEDSVDLVISDMRMPAMDGASLLEAVRRHDPGIVRILLTGHADIGATVAAINRGEVHRYIAKPWDDQDLLLVVRDALARRDLERQNARLQALTQAQNLELRDLTQHLEARVASRTAELAQVNAMLETAYSELNDTFTLALTVFAGLMEIRQDGIAGHSRRVAALVRPMAERLGLGPRAQEEARLAALLHDIGKIGYPDAMLGKPVSTYAPDELARHRQHTLDGEATLLPLARFQGVARIVRQHHERMDGKGFPDGLAGDQILLAARIVAVASDFDDLLHGSLAQRRYTPSSARQALQAGLHSHYDARVVAALFAVLDEIAARPVPDVAVDAQALQPGMVLAEDLLSPKGAILLAAGHVFEANVIRKLGELVSREQLRVSLRILRNSVPARTGLQRAAGGPGQVARPRHQAPDSMRDPT